MNPGSSQFASQFPDAEETMSKMESKKLQTILDCGQLKPSTPLADIYYFEALEHDARIAQELMDPARKTPETPLEREQREVIRQLHSALTESMSAIQYLHVHLGAEEMRSNATKSLHAATPFLED